MNRVINSVTKEASAAATPNTKTKPMARSIMGELNTGPTPSDWLDYVWKKADKSLNAGMTVAAIPGLGQT